MANRFIKMPTIASIGIHEEGLRRVSIAEAPSPASMPESETIHAVSAAPRFEPIITPTDCLSDIVPELTNPTTMTVVADDDCTTAVTISPRIKPDTGFEVILPSIDFS